MNLVELKQERARVEAQVRELQRHANRLTEDIEEIEHPTSPEYEAYLQREREYGDISDAFDFADWKQTWDEFKALNDQAKSLGNDYLNRDKHQELFRDLKHLEWLLVL